MKISRKSEVVTNPRKMSTPASMASIRRVKEQRRSSGKIAEEKSQKISTQVPHKDLLDKNFRRSTGKENLRVSGGKTPVIGQKPSLRPLPSVQRVDKIDVESRVRWSTSSLPKGKNTSNPTDFVRILSTLRNDSLFRVNGSDDKDPGRGSDGKILGSENFVVSTNSGKDVKGSTILKKCVAEKLHTNVDKKLHLSRILESKINKPLPEHNTTLDNLNKNVFLGTNSLKLCGNPIANLCALKNIQEKSITSLERGNLKEDNLNIDSIEKNVKLYGKRELTGLEVQKHDKDSVPMKLHLGGSYPIDSYLDKNSEDCDVRSHVVPKQKLLAGTTSKPSLSETINVMTDPESNEFGASENPKKKVDTTGITSSLSKYPSKLREKLAFLEGKVKKIASDIKTTKDILDKNNPDSSKIILCDIQQKISGIEKAVEQVIDDSKDNILFEALSNEGSMPTHKDNGNEQLITSLKTSVKDMNNNELEERLFPHHKLLRNRTCSGDSLIKAHAHQIHYPKVNISEENPITRDILASLGLEKTDSNLNIDPSHVEISTVHEMETENHVSSSKQCLMDVGDRQNIDSMILDSNETLEEFDDKENKSDTMAYEEVPTDELYEIGCKTSTGGWFVCEGESVLLAHCDGSCSFYDIVNCEEKSIYKPHPKVPQKIWGDCWLMRAGGSDGCSGKYVVAASTGNDMSPTGFCSWDYYTKEIRSFRVLEENHKCWYKPCGPLLLSAASGRRFVSAYDIRDGDLVMKWDLPRPVTTMENSSPLQWRNRGKVVVAETEAISLWDVNSLAPQPLLSVACYGKKVSALHVSNTDAEPSGGVRQRMTSSEADGNDGVFCTQDAINVLDFRLQSGIALKIPIHGVNNHSIFSRGDSIVLGCNDIGLSSIGGNRRLMIQQFSLRKAKFPNFYLLPDSLSRHSRHSSITQVWGNSNLVMGITGLGLFVFDSIKHETVPPFSNNYSRTGEVKEVIVTDDFYCSSFDYSSSRILLISKDRPASWRYLS